MMAPSGYFIYKVKQGRLRSLSVQLFNFLYGRDVISTMDDKQSFVVKSCGKIGLDSVNTNTIKGGVGCAKNP